MANTVEGLAEVYKDHSCQLLLVYSLEDMISNQKAQSFDRMVCGCRCDVECLSCLVRKSLQGVKAILSATLERTGSNEISRLLLGTS